MSIENKNLEEKTVYVVTSFRYKCTEPEESSLSVIAIKPTLESAKKFALERAEEIAEELNDMEWPSTEDSSEDSLDECKVKPKDYKGYKWRVIGSELKYGIYYIRKKDIKFYSSARYFETMDYRWRLIEIHESNLETAAN